MSGLEGPPLELLQKMRELVLEEIKGVFRIGLAGDPPGLRTLMPPAVETCSAQYQGQAASLSVVGAATSHVKKHRLSLTQSAQSIFECVYGVS